MSASAKRMPKAAVQLSARSARFGLRPSRTSETTKRFLESGRRVALPLGGHNQLTFRAGQRSKAGNSSLSPEP